MYVCIAVCGCGRLWECVCNTVNIYYGSLEIL